MEVLKIVNSLFSSCTYLNESLVIDPGDVAGIKEIKTVLLTHGHFDHIYGLNELLENNPVAKVYTNDFGARMLLDARLNMSKYMENPFVFKYPKSICIVKDGEEIEIVYGISAKAIFTPGHNPSCITWEIRDMLFTGDAYIPGIKVVTNLSGSNKKDAEKSLELIMKLAENHVVYPGHQIEEQ